MRSFISLILCLLISSNLLARNVVVFAEHSPNEFIQVEHSKNGFRFFKCNGNIMNDFGCDFLVGDNYFTVDELDEIAFTKQIHSGAALVADLGILIGLIYTGGRLGLGYAPYFVSISYGNGINAIGPGITGMGLGGISAIALETFFDALKPYVHGDLAISFYSMIDDINRSDKKHVEAFTSHSGLVVTIDDIEFDQLVSSYRKQLKNKLEDRD